MIETLLLRLLVLVVLAAGVGVKWSVCRQYAIAWRHARGERRLTPAHVTLVTLFTLGLEGTLAWGQIDAITGITTSPTWAVLTRTALYGVCSLGISASLLVVRASLVRAAVLRAEQAEGHPPEAVGS